MWDWIAGIADVVDNDPDQTDQEACQHERSQPFWALLGKWSHVGYLFRNVERVLLAALGLRHE